MVDTQPTQAAAVVKRLGGVQIERIRGARLRERDLFRIPRPDVTAPLTRVSASGRGPGAGVPRGAAG